MYVCMYVCMYVDLLIWVGKPKKERAAVIMVETSRAGVAPPLLTAGRVSFNSHPRGRPPRMFQLKSLGCDDEPRPVALPAAASSYRDDPWDDFAETVT